ncbi:MAG: CocE/NonD family hydrolase [Chloroflexota bacterium]
MTFPVNTPLRAPVYKGAATQPLYVSMRDGVRLAVDISLPRGLGNARIPTLFAATRYWRAQQLRAPFAWFFSLPDSARDFFTAYGYAVLRIDMRGTGASEGDQTHPWPDSDLTDLYDLVEWVIRQAWSDGKVGGFGNSYQATTAEMLGACGHPAVRSSLVRFNEYDVFTDIAFPGGVPNEFILREWAAFNRALDANRLPKRMSMLEKILIRGVKPVDQPIPNHNNQQVDSALQFITFRDDVDPHMGASIDQISIHKRSTTNVLDHWGGWFDAATADAVIRRFANNPRPQRAVIGPWNHGATQHVGLQTPEKPFTLLAQMQAALRLFDEPVTTRELHYYTLNENKWKTTNEWPPLGVYSQSFFFQAGGSLVADRSKLAQQSVALPVDYSVTTGFSNRWQTELDQRPVKYAIRKDLLSFNSAPFERTQEICGYPIVTLYIKSSHSDGAFFVYLEAVDEKGQAQYLTEGLLRALHRKLSSGKLPYKQFVPFHSFLREDAMPLVPGEWAELNFGLNPISALIRAGWHLRVSVAGADKDTFLRIPAVGQPEVEIGLGGELASYLEIPFI